MIEIFWFSLGASTGIVIFGVVYLIAINRNSKKGTSYENLSDRL